MLLEGYLNTSVDAAWQPRSLFRESMCSHSASASAAVVLATLLPALLLALLLASLGLGLAPVLARWTSVRA